MSDLRLRLAARGLAADPSPEAQAALLRERLRAGLDPQRAELAAYCGHEGARLAWGCRTWGTLPLYQENPKPNPGPDGTLYEFVGVSTDLAPAYALAPWVRGLSRWGAEAQVRAAIAAARVALERWEEQEGLISWEGKPGIRDAAWEWRLLPEDHPKRSPRRAIEAAESWVACPCEEHEVAWSRAGIACAGGGNLVLAWLPIPADVDTHEHNLGQVPRNAAHLAGEAPVREAIQRALIEWSLA